MPQGAPHSPQPSGPSRPVVPPTAAPATASPHPMPPPAHEAAPSPSIPSVAGLRLNTGGMLGQNAIATPAHHPSPPIGAVPVPTPTPVAPSGQAGSAHAGPVAPHAGPPQRTGPAANAPAPTYEEKRLAKLQSSGATVQGPGWRLALVNKLSLVMMMRQLFGICKKL
ncbi:unnamed protein product, partial [Darwinula stevensoni]